MRALRQEAVSSVVSPYILSALEGGLTTPNNCASSIGGQHRHCLNSRIRLHQGTRFSSSHWRTPFLETIPITRVWSSALRYRYKRMTYPQTLQTSSHSASNSSHQRLLGDDGREMPRCREESKIAALTIVGTAYRVYTGV